MAAGTGVSYKEIIASMTFLSEESIRSIKAVYEEHLYRGYRQEVDDLFAEVRKGYSKKQESVNE